MDQLKNDLIHSLRIIARSPGFAAVAILALAMGIGANSALFSVVNAVLLRPLPYGNPDRLVVITEKNPQTPSMSVAYPDFLDYTNKSRSFERLAAYRWAGGDLTGVEVPERLDNYQVSAGYFEILGATPIHGRTFLPDEDRPGAAPAIVLGNDVWQRQFGSDPNVVGRSVVINGLSYSVVGVMPASFRYPAAAQSWTTIGRVGNLLTDRGVHQGLTVVGLLKAGVGVDQARAEISTIADNLAREYKATNEGVGVNVGLLREQIIGGVRVLLMVLLGAVGFVLLIACANVANLLLARSASRQKEIAMRVALGAGRTRIVRQLLTESVLMSLIGGALGVAVAYWAIRFVKATNPANGNIPRLQEVNIDGRVLLVTLVISLLTGVIFGLAPALQSSRPDLNETLKEGGRGSDGGAGGSTTRKLLVVAEVALALVVSIGGGLMIKGFVHLMRTDAGFNPDGVVVMSLALPASRYPDADKQTSLYKGLLNRVSSLPGVQSVGLVNPLPLYEQGNQSSSMQEGVPFRRENIVRSDFLTVSPDYFAAMGIGLKMGRYFSDFDNETAPSVVIVDQLAAERFWPGQNPIGKRMAFELKGGGDGPPIPVWREVVGVVDHVRHYGLTEVGGQQVYVSYLQMPNMYGGILPSMSLVIRTNGEKGAVAANVRNVVSGMDGNLPVYHINTMAQILADSVSRTRLTTEVMTTFSVIGLILAAIGIYGVLSQSVTQRRHEIGVRMALGAKRGDLVKMIAKQGMILTVIGLAIGIGTSILLTPVLKSVVVGVTATDPVTYIWVTVVLAVIALLSCSFPALRATRVDPLTALRCE